ncbi:hypothetical protein M422DRAFT_40709 [Sphaerobolus stellatus SS14]|nr:hypothetical protein M422DRAFT_40709 [Sphaerobolus stellatus SS14]
MKCTTAALVKFERRKQEERTAQILGPLRAQVFGHSSGASYGQYGQAISPAQNTSHTHSDSQMLSMTQQIEEERKKAAMYNAATSVFNLLGGGGMSDISGLMS